MISTCIAQGREGCTEMIAASESSRRSPDTPNSPGISACTPPPCQNRVGTLHQPRVHWPKRGLIREIWPYIIIRLCFRRWSRTSTRTRARPSVPPEHRGSLISVSVLSSCGLSARCYNADARAREIRRDNPDHSIFVFRRGAKFEEGTESKFFGSYSCLVFRAKCVPHPKIYSFNVKRACQMLRISL